MALEWFDQLHKVDILHGIAKPYVWPIRRMYYDLMNRDGLITFTKDCKSDVTAREDIEAYELFAQKGKYLKTLQYFSRSLRHARTDECIAQLYLKRALILFKMGFQQQGSEDIRRAGNHGLYLSPSNNERITLLTEGSVVQLESSKVPIPVIEQSKESTDMPYAVDGVALHHSELHGFHMRAEKDISAGEIILMEPALSCGIIKDSDLHCHHCMKSSLNPIPCPKCTQVQFCSDSCLELASSEYHDIECKLLKTLAPLLERHYSEFRALISLRTYSNNQPNPNKTSLLRKITRRHPVKTYNLYRSEVAHIYHIVKEHTTYFDEVSNNYLKHDIFIGLLFKLMLIGITDTFRELTVEMVNKNAILDYQWCGMYVFASLFNHSCNPNVSVTFYGSTLELRTMKCVPAGSQFFINYKMNWILNPSVQRQGSLLKQYCFNCRCVACNGSWSLERAPVMTERDSSLVRLLKIMYEKAILIKNIRSEVDSTYRDLIEIYMSEVRKGRIWKEPSLEWYLYQKAVLKTHELLGRSSQILCDLLNKYKDEDHY